MTEHAVTDTEIKEAIDLLRWAISLLEEGWADAGYDTIQNAGKLLIGERARARQLEVAVEALRAARPALETAWESQK